MPEKVKTNCNPLKSNNCIFAFQQTEKAKWEPLNVLKKLDGDQERKTGTSNHLNVIFPVDLSHKNVFKEELFVLSMVLCFSLTDLMEELGLGDVDDLEGKIRKIIFPI